MGNKKASRQTIPGSTKITSDKPIRGIDWKGIFLKRPDLEPPGYKQIFNEMKQTEQKAS